MGFKDTTLPTGPEKTRADMLSTLALDALFSRESEHVDRWFGDGLVASDFGAGLSDGRYYRLCSDRRRNH